MKFTMFLSVFLIMMGIVGLYLPEYKQVSLFSLGMLGFFHVVAFVLEVESQKAQREAKKFVINKMEEMMQNPDSIKKTIDMMNNHIKEMAKLSKSKKNGK